MELSDLEKKLAQNPDLGVDCGNLTGVDEWEMPLCLGTKRCDAQDSELCSYSALCTKRKAAAEIAAMPTRDMGELLTSSKRRPRRQKATGVDVVKESEEQFMTWCVDLAHARGWKVAHFRPAMTKAGNWVTPVSADGKGFPDLILVRDGRIIAAELKSDSGKLSTEQHDWLTKLNQCIPAFMWGPSDRAWIEELLK